MKWLRKDTSAGVRKAPAMLIALGLVFGPLLFTAPAAHAGSYDDLTGSPGQECRPQSLGNAAGSGFPGIVDSQPAPIAPANASPEAADAANALQEGANKRIYHVYGWAGYNWEVCATGGPVKGAEALGNTDAWSDNERGSTMLKTATAIAALNTGVAKMAAQPGEVMKPLDNIVADLSRMLRDALVDLWFPIVLVAAGAIIAVNAINGNLRRALASVGAIVGSIVAVAYLSFAPLQAAQLMDGIASAGQAAVLQNAAAVAGKENVPADETWGVIYSEDIIFPLWAQGITGWSGDDPRLKPNLDAERMGPTIKADQKFDAFTPTRAYQIRAYPWGAEKTEQTDNDRRDAWNTIGEASQTKDAPTRAFTGQDMNRTGYGAMALASVASSAAFNIPANMVIFVSQIAFRLLPIVGLVLALLLAFEPTRPLSYVMGRFFLACLVNGVIVGAFAAVHLAIVGALFNSTLGTLGATIATAIVSVIFFKITKPVRSLTNTAVSFGKGLARSTKRLRNKNNQGQQNGPNGTRPDTRASRFNPQGDRRVQPLKTTATQTLINTGTKTGLTGVGTKAAADTAKRAAAAGYADARSSRPGTKPAAGTTSGTTKQQQGRPQQSGQTPAQSRYTSLQQAQQTGEAARSQRRMFVPPNAAGSAPKAANVTPAEKGDRPTQRKFIPPVPSTPPGQPGSSERTVEPLKNARS